MGFYYLHNFKYMANQITEDFEEWTPLLLHLLECNRLKLENEQLRNQIKHLETQVYGGTTK
jgi:regulator of replication initiation timing